MLSLLFTSIQLLLVFYNYTNIQQCKNKFLNYYYLSVNLLFVILSSLQDSFSPTNLFKNFDYVKKTSYKIYFRDLNRGW